MIKIHTAPQFKKSIQKIPYRTQTAFQKKLKLFRQDPFYPPLKTHKLSGKMKSYYSFSVSYSYRVLFKFLSKNEALFINIGTHEIYK